MTRLPTPGSDNGAWGNLLNDYLLIEHDVNGTLKIRTDGTMELASNKGAANGYAPLNASSKVPATNLPLAVAPVALTDAPTIATDASLGNLFRVTLGGNRTLGNPTNPIDGQKVIWELIQDVTGSRTITLGSNFTLGTDITSITLTTAVNKRDFLGAVYNATTGKWYVIAFTKGY
ncbi:MAG: hypothetical protein JWP06_176 [Candidatus Saccharibacteria bacterium]|nr:hypothetical protein [Candidatus Saccharibacteria bacterium]